MPQPRNGTAPRWILRARADNDTSLPTSLADDAGALSKPAPRLPPRQPSWPRLMRADKAAAYVDEKSVSAFRRGVGRIYPRPIKISGKAHRWLRDDLDVAIDRLAGRLAQRRDAADEL